MRESILFLGAKHSVVVSEVTRTTEPHIVLMWNRKIAQVRSFFVPLPLSMKAVPQCFSRSSQSFPLEKNTSLHPCQALAESMMLQH